MSITKNGFRERAEYTVTYSGMRGVDFDATAESGRTRPAYLENMYRDYDGDGGRIESIPGFRRFLTCGASINALYMQRTSDGQRRLIVHAGNTLYRVMISETNDLSGAEKIGTVNDFQSHGFSYGYDLYLLDGKQMWRIPEDGIAIAVGKEGAMPYVPTTFMNGVEYEQRNLLTDRFKEQTLLTSTNLFTYGSHEVYYRITDADKRFCAAIGVSDAFELGPLHIPSYVDIGGEKYRVTEIADGAFSGNVNINSVKLNEGVLRIGQEAFSGCTSLLRVFGCETLAEIDSSAFSGCTIIEEIYLGRDLERFGENAFSGCGRLAKVYYSARTENFALIENSTAIGSARLIKAEIPHSMVLDIPLYTPTGQIESVAVDGAVVSHTAVRDGDKISSVMISSTDRRALEGKRVIVNGVALQNDYTKTGAQDLFSTPGYTGTGAEAVGECRICECFDGRIFLSGNPRLPNTVIYSARNESGNNDPLYFGTLNYFNDGTGTFPVVSMLSAGDSLAVFKSDDDGGGSIFYHTPKSTDSGILPRVYPVSYVHGGIGGLGESISFFDDPVFIARSGVCALDKRTITLERSVACRSHNVNPLLLCEDLSRVRLGKWCGYLVVSVGGKVFLADSRATYLDKSGHQEYEWYYLSGVGTYKNATRVYRYASIAPAGYLVHPTPEERVTDTVMSVKNANGELIYYTEGDDGRYVVYPTEDYEGGVFSAASAILTTDDDLFFFGTESGNVCVFNNDRRGTPPPDIAADEDFDNEEYAIKYSRRIHPSYYRFDDHLPTYALRTVLDNCGIPHLTKSTVKHSLAIKMSVTGSGSVICEVGTDCSGYKETARVPNAEIDFSCFDFAHLAFETADHFTIPISEKEKGWIEKEIAIRSSDGAPIAIYSMSYRFTVKGRIKKKG